MITVLTGISLAIYLAIYAMVRRRRRSFPAWAVVAFIAAISSAYASVVGPLDELSDRSLSWHMVQHFLLTGVTAPLLVLSAPIRLALAALPTQPARKLASALRTQFWQLLNDPFFAWLQFQAVMYTAHLSPLYEAALENENIHAFEHLLFIVSAALFWQSIIAVAPVPHIAPYHVRILLLVFAIPMGSLLGFIFYVSRSPWYAHYAHLQGALQDQHNAGALMWGLGSMPFFIVLLACVASWSKNERRLAAVQDR